MKSLIAHLRDEQQQRNAKAREQAIAASSENDPRADINVPYESPPEFKRMMAKFGKTDSSEPMEEPIDDIEKSSETPEKSSETPEETSKPKKRKSKFVKGFNRDPRHGYSQQEIADAFEITQATVSADINTAFKAFRQDPELARWAAASKRRPVPKETMPPINAETPWSEIRNFQYMKDYTAHLKDHASPHTGQTTPGRRKALPSKPAAEETTRVLKQQNGEWTEMGESTKTFRDIMVLLTEKMRRDPKQEKARLTARLKNIESETPKMSREEEKLAISTSPEVKKSKAGRIASGKLFKRGMKQAQAGDVDAALQGVEDVISGARGKKASVLEREFGSKSNVRAYRTARSRYNKK